MPSGGVTDVVSRDRPCSTAPVPAPNAMDMSRQQQRKRDLDQRSTKTVTEGDLPRGVDAKSRRCMTEDEEMRGRRNVSAVDSTFTGSTASCDSDEDFSIVSASAGTCKEDTLIIFDWDDTILPTRFLTVECGLRVDGPDPDNELRKILDTYAQLANATLLAAMELGTVMIVTNAETGWLPLTCAKFLPSMMPTVSMIYHTSARSTFEPRGFASAFEWKEQAFRHAIASHFADVPSLPGRRRCVISLGDSAHERMAAIYACREFNEQSMIDSSSPAGLLCKSLKFMERPDLEHLRKEQYLIQDCLAQVVRYDQDLDLCIQPQQCLVKDDTHGNPGGRMQSQHY